MFNPDLVLAKLVALGDTPDAVAESLRRLGIKGVVGDSCDCPLAKYVMHHCGLPARWVCDANHCDTTICRAFDVKAAVLSTPPACADFITWFDALCYPDLIDPDRPIITYCHVGPGS